ncbi:MAG: class I SAM-dependent methyltransferase [Planctomycetaceae bacterium]|nr:class I SAM-dependent methyltransferase [Planctomycetaceae bacterium]
MLKQLVGRIGQAAGLTGRPHFLPLRRKFTGSNDYWVRRYRKGRNSGGGSYGRLAAFKAQVLNDFVRERGIQTVIEFGCGDGNQLALATYPQYLGFDISRDALALCRTRFADDPSRTFRHVEDDRGEQAQLALSLDVLYHLVEDDIFERYVRRLFSGATEHVVIYSSNTAENGPQQGEHVRHRRFTDWIDRSLPEWRLVRHLPNAFPFEGDDREGSFADFFFYERPV